jgi:hypothetical protein
MEGVVAMGGEQFALPVGHGGGVQTPHAPHDQSSAGVQFGLLRGERGVRDLGDLRFNAVEAVTI